MSSPHPAAVSAHSLRLADQLERVFRGGAWHGPAVAQALAGVDAATAARRPIPDAHSIWEIAGHVATWMEVASRRIAGERVDEVSPEEDFPPAPDAPDEEAWRRLGARLEEAHRGLHATVLELPEARLEDPVSGSDPTVRGLLLGVLQHNAYHAGQIVLLRRAAAGEGA